MVQFDIQQIEKGSAEGVVLNYQYRTNAYYDFLIRQDHDGWQFQLQLKSFDRFIEKRSESVLFSSYIENPLAFLATQEGQPAGYLQLGFEEWNKRIRIWDILVVPEFRRQNLGSEFIKIAMEQARTKRARAIVLETQSCNVPAIQFYLKHGFSLIGFDLVHYSNRDLDRREVRLEMARIIPEDLSKI